MDLNKLKRGVATMSAVVLMGLTSQTKAAVAETLSYNQKTLPQTEELASIVNSTAESMGDTFFVEPDISNDTNNTTDTSNVIELFNTPGFLSDAEKTEFDTLRNDAIKHKYREIYKGEILELFQESHKNSDKAILVLAILYRVDSTSSLTKRAFTEIEKDGKLERVYSSIKKMLISKEKLEISKEKLEISKEKLEISKEKGKELDIKIQKIKKEIEETKENTEKLKKLNKSLEEMVKLFEEYQK